MIETFKAFDAWMPFTPDKPAPVILKASHERDTSLAVTEIQDESEKEVSVVR